MQINAISPCCPQKINYINKVNLQKQPSFGKIKWQSKDEVKKEQAEYEINQRNNRINDFFCRMQNFETNALSSAKYAKNLAKAAYKKGKANGFEGEGEACINNIPCRVSYSSYENSDFITIENSKGMWGFTFDKGVSSPKEIHSLFDDSRFKYILTVTPEKTKYVKEDKLEGEVVARYAKYEDGRIYEEPSTAFMSNSCKRGIIKGIKKIFQKEEADYGSIPKTTTYQRKMLPGKWYEV